jgi:hypothetical protein
MAGRNPAIQVNTEILASFMDDPIKPGHGS